jgi:hypothetical protein
MVRSGTGASGSAICQAEFWHVVYICHAGFDDVFVDHETISTIFSSTPWLIQEKRYTSWQPMGCFFYFPSIRKLLLRLTAVFSAYGTVSC